MTSHQQPILIKHYKLCLLVMRTAEGICSILNTNNGIKHEYLLYVCNFIFAPGYFKPGNRL